MSARTLAERVVVEHRRRLITFGVTVAIFAGVWLLLVVSAINHDRVLIDSVRAAFGVSAAVYALGAVGLNMHFGYTGLLNFGHVGFLLVGAYGLGITVSVFGGPFWLGIIMGVLLSVLLAVALGIPTLRLRADYLAIVTIAAAEILRFLFRSGPATELTGGVFGLTGVADRFLQVNPIPAGRYQVWVLNFSHRRVWVLLVGWGLVVLASILVWLLVRSPWGRVLKAIRDDEDAARSLGKNVFAYKMQSLIVGGVIGGLAGIVLAVHFQTIHPDTFLPIVTFFIYAILILGGPASIIGPIVGSIVFWFLIIGIDSALRQALSVGYIPSEVFTTEALGALRFALVGVGLLALMIYRPHGMFGSKREMQLDV